MVPACCAMMPCGTHAHACVQYGGWDKETFRKHEEEYRVLGDNMSRPQTDEEVLKVYYFLRNRTQVYTYLWHRAATVRRDADD